MTESSLSRSIDPGRAVTLAPSLPDNNKSDKNQIHPLTNDEIIRKVAKQALIELAIALTLAAICIPFTIGSVSLILLFALPVAGVILNTTIHFTFFKFFNNDAHSRIHSRIGRSAIFAKFCSDNSMTLAHEAGHFGMAKLLYTGESSIQVNPLFQGGSTSYSSKTLTPLGKKIGNQKAQFWITLAGPALAILVASVALIAGLILNHSHPEISAYLIGIGLMVFLDHSIYAFSALWSSPTNLSHDFVRMSLFGISPIFAGITMIAIPIVIIMGYLLYNHIHTHQKKNEEKLEQPTLTVTS